MMDFLRSERFRSALWWLLALALLVTAWQQYGAAGLVLAAGVLLFWLLLQFTRVMTVMKNAARHPKGHVVDAARLHRRLRLGVKLFDLVRATGSLGEPASPEGAQPEIFHWTDSGGVRLVCRFDHGRLVAHELTRADDTPFAQP